MAGKTPTTPQDLVNEAMASAKTQVRNLQRSIEGVAGEAASIAAESAGELELPSFEDADPQARIDLLGDVNLDVTIELGRIEMLVEDVLRLSAGSVVELDKLAGDPVDVYVNNRLIARGEVLVLNDNFCIRISEIVANVRVQAEAAAEAGA